MPAVNQFNGFGGTSSFNTKILLMHEMYKK